MSDNPKRRSGLGRGLGALIVNTDTASPSPDVVAQAEAGGIRLLAVNAIGPNPHQPRASFDPDLLAELAASIREHGIIQPLIVTQAADETERYWIVAGERRWRAARQAGLAEVPVILREATPQQLMEWALVENIQRADLNAIEEATAYVALMEEFGMTQAQVAERVGKSRSAVANLTRLLQLPTAVQTAVIDDNLSAGHARALLALDDHAAMEECMELILRRELSVRQTEDLVRSILRRAAADREADQKPDPHVADRHAHLQMLENRFRSSLGTKVNLNRNPDGTGRLVIHFYNDDDLEGLYQRLIGEEEL